MCCHISYVTRPSRRASPCTAGALLGRRSMLRTPTTQIPALTSNSHPDGPISTMCGAIVRNQTKRRSKECVEATAGRCQLCMHMMLAIFLLKLIFVEELGVCFCRLLLNASHASTSLIWPRLHGGNARSTERVVEWHLGSHDRVAAVWFGDRNCRFRLAGP